MKPKPSKITVTILGSGTCVPSLARSACAVLIQTDNTRILMDIGPGTMHRLLETGTSIFDIDYVLISHFHPDHTAELVPFLFATRYPDIRNRKKPLTIVGGAGLTSFYNALNAVYRHWIDLPGLLTLIELPDGGGEMHNFQTFTLTTQPMAHRPESLAYRIAIAGEISVVYSGDTDYTDNLIALARETDLLICESAFPDDLKVEGHMTPSLAGRIAAAAHAKQLVLTHFYPECDPVDLQRQCRKTYGGPLILAEDLMTITVETDAEE